MHRHTPFSDFVNSDVHISHGIPLLYTTTFQFFLLNWSTGRQHLRGSNKKSSFKQRYSYMDQLSRAAMNAIINPTEVSDQATVPGQYGCRLLNEFDMMLNGHGYFYKKIQKNKSTVFKTHVGRHMTTLCNREAIDTMYDPDKILKETSFLKSKLNSKVLSGNIPSVFANGDHHMKLKTFEIELVRIIQEDVVVECVNQTILDYFKKWKMSVPVKNFEDELQDLTRNVNSFVLFGGRLNFEQIEIWRKGLFAEVGSDDENSSRYVLPNVLNEIQSLPKIECVRKISREIDLPIEEALCQCLFIIGFNAQGSTVALTSCIAELHLLNDDMKARLKEEIMRNIKGTGLTHKALCNMKLLESFVQEVCRLHPPVSLIFGKTKKDVLLQSNSGEYIVKKDEPLLGEVYICQRDPNIFEDPNQFNADRFYCKEGLLNNLLSFGGPYNADATPTDHKCPGQEIAMDFLKAVLVYFISSCQYTLAGDMSWKDKRLQRLSRPDSPLCLTSFAFEATSDLFKDMQDIKLEEYFVQDLY